MCMNDLPQGEKYIKKPPFSQALAQSADVSQLYCGVLHSLRTDFACHYNGKRMPASGAHTYRRLIYRGVVCAENGSGLYAGSPGNSPAHR